MKISKITISNFRSIRNLVIEPQNLSALIGPNSSGKTNVLRAVDLVLGEGWVTKAKVARELFFDTSKSIIIEVEFESPIDFINKRGIPVSVSSIKLEMSLEPELTAKTTINGNNKFYDQDLFKKYCHFILIPSERQLGEELRVSQWTMLGKLMRLVYENYIHSYGDEELLKTDFADKIKPAKEFLEADFSNDVTFKKFSDAFKKYCGENSSGMANEFGPVLDIYNLNWFYKTLQIHVKEKFSNKQFDSQEIGAGMQNLLLISIFQTYAELMGGSVIFGIEEPEIYLYPHAQRSLYKNLVRLSTHTQIFYTTHNPNFLDPARPDDMTLLRKDESRGTYVLKKDPTFNAKNALKEQDRIYTHFNQERNELFFARKALLVEGDSDKLLFVSLCEGRWGIDLDAKGISIIPCGGKGGIIYFIGVCKLIGFQDYFAVWDGDEAIDQTTLLTDAVNQSRAIELDPNLEGVLGLPQGVGSGKVKQVHEWVTNPINNVPAEFDKVRGFLESETATVRADDAGDPATDDYEIRIGDIPF